MLSNSKDSGLSLAPYQRAAIVGVLLFAVTLTGAQSVPPPVAPQGQTQSQTSTTPTQSSVQPVVTPPLIMIDPAHGGSESGAVLNPTILEKDVTLALARRLRLDLSARGFVVELVRDSDINLSTDDRAAKSNAAHPAL